MTASKRWRCYDAGRVMRKRRTTECLWRVTAVRRPRCDSSNGVQALDLGGLRQYVATGESVFDSNRVEQEPGNGSLVWGKGARDALGIGVQLGPDRAPVLRVNPCGANRAIGHHRWTNVRVMRVRVGAEEVGDELITIVVEQRGLRREEYIGDAIG